MEDKRIKFHFQPYNYDTLSHAVEKEENGLKRKYLKGISSGLREDHHGEKMTKNCIDSFMDQANSGEVLLFTDKHGVKSSEDIGILNKAEILPDGDWFTEYRLYDEADGIGAMKTETIDTVWKQTLGLKPYTKPRQKGFSVEGFIPKQSIIYNTNGSIQRGVLDNIALDGVVLVPRPAYKDSIATAVYKALNETSPERLTSLQTELRSTIELENLQDSYYKNKWKFQDALETIIEKIMTKNNTNFEEELNFIFDEYKSMFIDLILQSSQIFVKGQDFGEETADAGSLEPYSLIGKSEDNSKLNLYGELLSALKEFSKNLED